MDEQSDSGSREVGAGERLEPAGTLPVGPGADAAPAAGVAVPATVQAGDGVEDTGNAGVQGLDGKGAPGGIQKVGRKNFAAVYVQGKDGAAGKVVPLSDQEAVVLNSFLTSHCYKEAAKAAGGITVESVKRMLRRPGPKSFLEEVVRKATVMQNMDLAWLAKEMMGVWEGAIKPTDEQMKAAKIIEHLVTPKAPRGGGVTVNVQQQQNSVYSMGKEALDAEWTDARATADPGV